MKILLIALLLTAVMFSGCVESDPCGTYTYGNINTLRVYENNTFLFTERLGYLMGREVNMSVRGTYTQEEDIIIFSGDGVVTTAHIQGGNLIINGNKYTKISQ